VQQHALIPTGGWGYTSYAYAWLKGIMKSHPSLLLLLKEIATKKL